MSLPYTGSAYVLAGVLNRLLGSVITRNACHFDINFKATDETVPEL